MNLTMRLMAKVLWFVLCTIGRQNVHTLSNNLPLVIMSFDGCRWDYLKSEKLRSFHNLIKDGVSAPSGLKPSFLTETYPNHMTLVTGLYPEHHGIIANKMYDPLFNDFFVFNTTDSKWFDGVEPLWITNEHAEPISHMGKNRSRKSAVIQWVGSNVLYNGKYPSFFDQNYNPSKGPQERFKEILQYLSMPEPPNLILCYFEEPDEIGHMFGPNSKKVMNVLEYYDELLGQFMANLTKLGLKERTNIVIVSDHGMTELKPAGAINISNIIDNSWYFASTLNTFVSIWPKVGFRQKIHERLKSVKHLNVYYKHQIPIQLNYRNHRRIAPIVALVDKGYYVHNQGNWMSRGFHGYSSDISDMNGIFIAYGPSFKSSLSIPTFENVHIYPLLCHMLGIEPRANNGSLEVLKNILVSQRSTGLNRKRKIEVVAVSISVLLITLTVVIIVVVFRRQTMAYRYSKLQPHKEAMDIFMDNTSNSVQETSLGS